MLGGDCAQAAVDRGDLAVEIVDQGDGRFDVRAPRLGDREAPKQLAAAGAEEV